MAWTILFHDAFEAEFREMAGPLQDELLAHAVLLREFGPKRRFYKRLIVVADARLDEHLAALAKEDKERRHGKKT